MALTKANTRLRPAFERNVALVDTTVNNGTINAGDLLYDTGAGVASLTGANTLTAQIVANIGKFRGVSRETYPIPYSDSLTETVTEPAIGFDVEGEFRFHSTAGDSLATGTFVRPGTANAQTVKVCEVGPDCSPAGLFVAGTVTGGTLLAQAYTVTATYITMLGETTVGPASAPITATAGQGIIYDFDNASAFVIPAWALGVAIYLNGVYAYSIMAGSTALAADLNITGIDLNNPRPAPLWNALAIGIVAEDQVPVGGTIGGTVTGASGTDVAVKIKVAPIY
jgi:hypothetical protein